MSIEDEGNTLGGLEQWLLNRIGGTKVGVRARRVFDYLVTKPYESSYSPASNIAKAVDVNAATVVRLAKSLGFDGWAELQRELRAHYLGTLGTAEVLDTHDVSNDPITASLLQSLANIKALIQTRNNDSVRSIVECITSAKQSLVIGSGSFAAAGSHLAYIGSQLGYEIRIERQGGTQLAAAIRQLGEGDVLIAMNLWKLPREILKASQWARDRGVVVGVITDVQSSPLSAVASHLVIVPSEGAGGFPSLAALVAVIDALLVQLAEHDPAKSRRELNLTGQLWAHFDLMHNEKL